MSLFSRFWFLIVLFLSLVSFSCEKEEIFVTAESGYAWPENDRSYWPTRGWLTSPTEHHSLDIQKLEEAHRFALADPLARALLIVKDGFLVYEKYYGDGGTDQSTNLWSVTKSVSSILVGFLMDQEYITSTGQLMADLMPRYPEFGDISLHHVLTQTTGLSWAESGPLWVEWVFSEDWVSSALARGFLRDPGEKFVYSSGNSHFLNSLVYYSTGSTPGMIAKKHFFDPMGIPFDTLSQSVTYDRWEAYNVPLYQSWRRDTRGIETASFGLFLRARDMAKIGYLYLNRGKWEGQQLVSEDWVRVSTMDHESNIYGRYSYGYQWWITRVGGEIAFLASGYGGQIIGVVPSLDMVVVLKYEAVEPQHPVPGSGHDDMHLFELAVQSVIDG